jgi:hypothetical protein
MLAGYVVDEQGIPVLTDRQVRRGLSNSFKNQQPTVEALNRGRFPRFAANFLES